MLGINLAHRIVKFVRAHLGTPSPWVFHGINPPRQLRPRAKFVVVVWEPTSRGLPDHPRRFPGATAPHLLGPDSSTPSLPLAACEYATPLLPREYATCSSSSTTPPRRRPAAPPPSLIQELPPPSPVQEPPPPPSLRICFHSLVAATFTPSSPPSRRPLFPPPPPHCSSISLGMLDPSSPHLPFPSHSPLWSRVLLSIDLVELMISSPVFCY
jgi:hypothetical protein